VSRYPSLIRGAAGLVVFLASQAAAQASDPLSKLDPTSRFAVEAMIDSARVLGLPSKYLWSRAAEGVAKNADSRKIVSAVRERFIHLKDARAVLGQVTDDELTAAADLLEAKVKPEALIPFRNPSRGRSPLLALTVLGDLVTRGVPREDALSAISRFWMNGAGDAEFMGLFQGVQSDILQGLNPGAALQNRVREFPGRAPANIKPTTPPTGEPETPNS
jgi:hypothetical protein